METVEPVNEARVDKELESDVARLISGSNITMRRESKRIYQLIDQYITTQRTQKAIDLLRKILTVDAGNMDAQLTLAALLKDNGAADEADAIVMRVFAAVETEDLLPRMEAISPHVRTLVETNVAWGIDVVSAGRPRIVVISAGKQPDMILREFGAQLHQLLKIPVEIKALVLPLENPERDPGKPWLDATYQKLVYQLSPEQQALLGLDFELIPAALRTREQKVETMERYYTFRGEAATTDHEKFATTLQRQNKRIQYDAGRIITEAEAWYSAGPDELVVIVAAGDLFAGSANFVFCAPRGRVSCLSSARSYGAFWGEAEHRPRLMQRMLKSAVWGIFSGAGQPVCTTPFCMRTYVHNREEQDRNDNRLCDTCAKQWEAFSGQTPGP